MTLKMDVVCIPRTLVPTYIITWNCIPGDISPSIFVVEEYCFTLKAEAYISEDNHKFIADYAVSDPR